MLDTGTILSSLKQDIFDFVRSRQTLIQSVLHCKDGDTPITFVPYTAGFNVADFPDSKHTKYAKRVKASLASQKYCAKADMKIWFNDTMPAVHFAEQIRITEHITSTDQSNGIENSDMVVFKGSMGPISMAIKFREVTAALTDLAENEANNAIKTHHNQEIKHLFPTLYFIMNLTSTLPSGQSVVWDVIGTELLDPVGTLLMTDTFYHQCFLLLKNLHSKGFIHGDAHRGNFMVRPGEFFDSTNPKVCMIDQDQIEALPENILQNKALRNYLQILDYHELLYHANPHCSYISDDPNALISIDKESWKLCKFGSVLNVFFIPFGFLLHRKANMLQQQPTEYHTTEKRHAIITQDLRRYVHRESGKRYWDFLQSIDTDEIDRHFQATFQTIASIKYMETYIRRALRVINNPPQHIQPYRQ